MDVTMYIQSEEGKRAITVPDTFTVLQAMQENHAHLDAPCGGNGKCKKCRVLVSQQDSVGYVLACCTKVQDGMEVVLESPKDMVVSVKGAFDPWELSEQDTARTGLGVAVDIGTTTVAVHLLELGSAKILATTGCSNPQIAYGADVISRISACSEGALEAQQDMIVSTLAQMTQSLLDQLGRKASEIEGLVIAGNTVMESLACGVDPEPIGTAPYIPLTLFGDDVTLKDAFFEALPQSYMVPCLAGYVGGDITAGMVATHLLHREKPTLFLDLGTNGEMALGSKNGAVACATAAGPVFEGANIRYGMPAYPGSISQVKMGENGIECKVIGDVEALGICGTGLIDAVALMSSLGIIDETGRFADEDEMPEAYAHLVTRDDQDAFFHLSGEVSVTQKDVRNLQLAKSAIVSGIMVMMDDLGVAFGDIEELLIAGGFGEYLNLENGAAIGLFPAPLLNRARSVGNSSLEGATQVLVSSAARAALEEVSAKTRYIELSTTPAFNEYYVENMYFEQD